MSAGDGIDSALEILSDRSARNEFRVFALDRIATLIASGFKDNCREELSASGMTRVCEALFEVMAEDLSELAEKAFSTSLMIHPLASIEPFSLGPSLEQLSEKGSDNGGLGDLRWRQEFLKSFGKTAKSLCHDTSASSSFLNLAARYRGERVQLALLLRQIGHGQDKIFARYCHERDRLLFPPQITLVPTYTCNLSCSYCCSKGLSQEYRDPLSMENLERILTWARDNGILRIGLMGGEPTCHHNFRGILRRLRSMGFEVWFSTNGTFDDEIIQELDPSFIKNIAFHIWNRAEPVPQRHQETFGRNLEKLCEKHIDVYLRYNVLSSESMPDWECLFQLCAQHAISAVNIALVFPGTARSNLFIGRSDFPRLAGTIVDFVSTCVKRGLEAHLAKPLPFCALSEAARRLLSAAKSLQPTCPIWRNNFTNNVMVNPDMSIRPCAALNSLPRHITDFDSLDDVGDYIGPHIRALLERKLYPGCDDCRYHESHLCQGACLGYKQ